MKAGQIFLILSALALFAYFGYAAYGLLWGPDRIEISGKSLPELLGSDALAVVIGLFAVLAITWLLVRPFARYLFPPPIRNGINSEARVLKVWDTGTTLNDDPEVGLLLEFALADGTPLQVETKTVVSRLKAALVQPGISARVRYDRQRPRRLRVLTLHFKETPSKSAAARMEELNELRGKGLIADEEYRRRREEFLRAL